MTCAQSVLHSRHRGLYVHTDRQHVRVRVHIRTPPVTRALSSVLDGGTSWHSVGIAYVDLTGAMKKHFWDLEWSRGH